MTITERNALIEQHLPYIWGCALGIRKRMPRHAMQDAEDLVGYGVMGLMDSIHRYDGSTNLLTFAKRRIVGAMIDGIRGEDWVPRVARSRDGTECKNMVPASQLDTDRCGPGDKERVPDDIFTRTPGTRSEYAEESELRELFDDLSHEIAGEDAVILRMHFLDHRTMKQIGDRRGCSQSWVSQRLSRSVSRIRQRRKRASS